MFNYDDSRPLKKDLVCKCYRCDKDIKDVSQFWDFYSGMFKIIIKCHGDSKEIHLTETQIDQVNKSGWYWAFMEVA